MRVSKVEQFTPITIRIESEVELLDLITALRFTAENHSKPWVKDSASNMADILDEYDTL